MAGLYDMAKMSVTGSPGTGTITLGVAVSGFQTFAAAGVPTGQTVSYSAQDGTSWEVGRGIYTSSGTTLTRGALFSSAGGSAISLTSTAQVWIAALAEDFGWQTSVFTGSSPLSLPLTPNLLTIVRMGTPAALTINLPASPPTNFTAGVKDGLQNFASNVATVKTTDGTQIENTAGTTGIPMAQNGGQFWFIFDGTQWNVL